MKEAGFGDGFEVELIVLAGNADEVATAAAMQQMWSAIGVKLTLQQLDNATRTDRYRKGDFQMRLGAWTDDIPDPCEITSYFVYIRTSRPSIPAGRTRRSTSSSSRASRRPTPPSAPRI